MSDRARGQHRTEDSLAGSDHLITCCDEPLGTGTSHTFALESEDAVQDTLQGTAVVCSYQHSKYWFIRSSSADLSCDSRNRVAGAASNLEPVRDAPIAVGVDGFSALTDFQAVVRIDCILEFCDELIGVLGGAAWRVADSGHEPPRISRRILPLRDLILGEPVCRCLSKHLGHEFGSAVALGFVVRRIEGGSGPAELGTLARKLVSHAGFPDISVQTVPPDYRSEYALSC